MNDLLLLGIAVVVLALAFVGATLPWRKFAEKWVANDPEKATVYVRDGEDLHPKPGRLVYQSDDCSTYRYSWAGAPAEVYVSCNYPVRYLKGRRLVAVTGGAGRATDLPMSAELDNSYLDLGAVVQGRVMVQLVKEISGPQRSPWLFVLVGAGALVAFFFVGQQLFPEQFAAFMPGTTPAPAPTEVP